jgi:CheY-like chemotaxis protein
MAIELAPQPASTLVRGANGRMHDLSAGGPEGQLILIVEDNRVNQIVAARMVARLGYRSETVRNGMEAVEAVSRQEYAAVLMDCQMPLMDGFEATRQIRRAEQPGRRLPIVAITALAGDDTLEQCMAAGMDDHLVKPLYEFELRTVLDHWVGSPRLPGS